MGLAEGPYEITEAYKQQTKEHVALAGATLANLLNAELK
jgi:hypothetical protein